MVRFLKRPLSSLLQYYILLTTTETQFNDEPNQMPYSFNTTFF